MPEETSRKRPKRTLRPQSELPREAHCPRCGASIWQGAPPRSYEFPLTCGAVGCEFVVTPKSLGYMVS